MLQHIRASLWLLFLTLLLCCVLYPLTLWAIGQTLFHTKAEGSLLTRSSDKQPVGSLLIAQSFEGDEYFQPRPSATSGSSYNAMASGGSNLAANNPKLRGRVAQQLGTLVRYRSLDGSGKGPLAGEDVEKWFRQQNDPGKGDSRRDLTAEWADKNPVLVTVWATSSDLIKDYLKKWGQEHAGVLAAWKKDHPQSTDSPEPEDLAPHFFDPSIADSFVKLQPGMWPATVEEEKNGKKAKIIKPANQGDEIRSIFFEMWLQEHPDAKLEAVPADMVMASGSGLDPHITLKNALYQLDRVASKWAEKTKRDPVQVRADILKLLEKARPPLGTSLAGVPLVNVLEVNLAVADFMKR